MRFTNVLAVAATIAAAGSAFGQSRSSFFDVDGFSALTLIENSALSYTLTLGSNVSVRVNNVDYPITQIFGFWSLSDDDNFSSASGNDFGAWDFHSNSASSGDSGTRR